MGSSGEAVPDAVRAQLLALGIPAARHGREELIRYFPSEFNLQATRMGAEDIARALVYLAGKNIISVAAPMGPSSIRKVQPGWHFCQFYRDFDQLLGLIAPYVAEGLKNNEGCLWVMPQAVSKRAARNAIAANIEDVDDYLASGQLEMLSHPDWYLDPFGRLKSFEEIAGALLGRQDRALARGFKFLRAAGDTGWVSGTEESRNFIDYEIKVNAALAPTQVAAVCTYRANVTADELVSIITAHQDALFRSAA